MRGYFMGMGILIVLGCGDDGPRTPALEGVWLASEADGEPLPQPIIARDGVVLLAIRLNIDPPNSSWARCEEISGDLPLALTEGVEYIERPNLFELVYDHPDDPNDQPDTLTVAGDLLTWRFTYGNGSDDGVDILTLERLAVDAPEATAPICDLAAE